MHLNTEILTVFSISKPQSFGIQSEEHASQRADSNIHCQLLGPVELYLGNVLATWMLQWFCFFCLFFFFFSEILSAVDLSSFSLRPLLPSFSYFLNVLFLFLSACCLFKLQNSAIILRKRHPYSLACLTCCSIFCLYFFLNTIPAKKLLSSSPCIRIFVWWTRWNVSGVWSDYPLLERFEELTRSLLDIRVSI